MTTSDYEQLQVTTSQEESINGSGKMAHLFLITNSFIRNVWLKWGAEFLLFENYSVSSSLYHPIIIGDIIKMCKCQMRILLEL